MKTNHNQTARTRATRPVSAGNDPSLRQWPPEPRREPTSPALRFSPSAWAKLRWFRDRGDTEIGGFGITPADDLLYIAEFMTVRQVATVVSVAFDDDAVADFYDAQVDAGRRPEQFSRIWLHTHPGDSPTPSGTDEETFDRVFGRCDWAVMFILARGGDSYARLRFNVGPGGQAVVPVQVDFTRPFAGSDPQAWEREYTQNVHAETLAAPMVRLTGLDSAGRFEADHPVDGLQTLDHLARKLPLSSDHACWVK